MDRTGIVNNGSHRRWINGLHIFLPLLPSLGCYRPESTADSRFLVVTGRKNPQSVVSLGSGLSAYRSTNGPIHDMGGTARYCKR
ncbi:hypothetical protein BHM03_00034124 [Ensete ventricosum]|nr:hypothetical protein BHM03_00034124 [Ensete ventricosum]